MHRRAPNEPALCLGICLSLLICLLGLHANRWVRVRARGRVRVNKLLSRGRVRVRVRRSLR